MQQASLAGFELLFLMLAEATYQATTPNDKHLSFAVLALLPPQICNSPAAGKHRVRKTLPGDTQGYSKHKLHSTTRGPANTCQPSSKPARPAVGTDVCATVENPTRPAELMILPAPAKSSSVQSLSVQAKQSVTLQSSGELVILREAILGRLEHDAQQMLQMLAIFPGCCNTHASRHAHG